MTDKQTPPDWVIKTALERCGINPDQTNLNRWRDCTYANAVRALCDMIERYEQPPVERKLLCAREALEQCGWVHNPDREETCIRAIELWEEGFGK